MSLHPHAPAYHYLELNAGSAATASALASECALALSCNELSQAVMMVSPSDLEDFAVGFCISQGLVESFSHTCKECEGRGLISELD